jgi:hypothetical protein
MKFINKKRVPVPAECHHRVTVCDEKYQSTLKYPVLIGIKKH